MCEHHWLIDSRPVNDFYYGRCIHCPAEKNFPTWDTAPKTDVTHSEVIRKYNAHEMSKNHWWKMGATSL